MEGEAVHLASALLHRGMGLGIIGRDEEERVVAGLFPLSLRPVSSITPLPWPGDRYAFFCPATHRRCH